MNADAGILRIVDIVLPPITDPVGEALHFLRMSGIFYCRSEFTAPWALDMPPMKRCLMLHLVTEGRCWLEVAGAPNRLLQIGDLALVPHGEGHRLTSEPGLPGVPLFEAPREEVSDRYENLRLGGGGARATAICGLFQFDHPAAHHLMDVLPKVIAVESWNSPHHDWIQGTLRVMAAEARAMLPGGETVITRLADILVIQAIRSWIAQDPAAQTGWLGALQDKQVGRAITAIHRDPAQPWTLESLASAAAMSRSAFAARFTQLVGKSAMHYLTRWRMHVAVSLLRENDSPLIEIANRLGYDSEAAFSRAFKRHLGVSPGSIRRDKAIAEA